MVKTYQLVAWTDNGKAKMIPSEISSFLHKELDNIGQLSNHIRYKTNHEVHDLLQLSSAYEKLGIYEVSKLWPERSLSPPERINFKFRQVDKRLLPCVRVKRVIGRLYHQHG